MTTLKVKNNTSKTDFTNEAQLRLSSNKLKARFRAVLYLVVPYLTFTTGVFAEELKPNEDSIDQISVKKVETVDKFSNQKDLMSLLRFWGVIDWVDEEEKIKREIVENEDLSFSIGDDKQDRKQEPTSAKKKKVVTVESLLTDYFGIGNRKDQLTEDCNCPPKEKTDKSQAEDNLIKKKVDSIQKDQADKKNVNESLEETEGGFSILGWIKSKFKTEERVVVVDLDQKKEKAEQSPKEEGMIEPAESDKDPLTEGWGLNY